MLPRSTTTRATIPGVRVNMGAAKETSLIVNHRNLGAKGDLSQSFGSNSVTSREKMQLRHLMAKTSSELYENNPVAQRRVQQQITERAGELYGIDPKKLMNGGSKTVQGTYSSTNAGASSNYGVRIPGSTTAPTNNPWNTSTTFSVQDKMRAGINALGR